MAIPRVKLRTGVLLAVALLAPLGATGCDPLGVHLLVHPFSMGAATPVPVARLGHREPGAQVPVQQDRLSRR